MGHPRLPARAQGHQIFRAVAHIEGDLVAGLGAAADHRTGEAVHGLVGLAPVDHPLAVDESRRLGGDRPADHIQNIPEIPTHRSTFLVAAPRFGRAFVVQVNLVQDRCAFKLFPPIGRPGKVNRSLGAGRLLLGRPADD